MWKRAYDVGGMTMKKQLPVGVENFEDIVKSEYYYVDKTMFIKELLDLKGGVNLFTRPRRFGKTLNLSMLRYFFEDTGDAEKNARNKALFQGLKIMETDGGYTEQMGRYPVINLTLKSAKQPVFDSAYGKMKGEIAEEFRRHQYVLESSKIAEEDKRKFREIAGKEAGYDDYSGSIKFLSKCLYQATGKNTVILIDEYDVPLNKAYWNGYYLEMATLIRSVFSQVLKTNKYLFFAVITGCLRIAKESIFTGLNNFKVRTISDIECAKYF